MQTNGKIQNSSPYLCFEIVLGLTWLDFKCFYLLLDGLEGAKKPFSARLSINGQEYLRIFKTSSVQLVCDPKRSVPKTVKNKQRSSSLVIFRCIGLVIFLRVSSVACCGLQKTI